MKKLNSSKLEIYVKGFKNFNKTMIDLSNTKGTKNILKGIFSTPAVLTPAPFSYEAVATPLATRQEGINSNGFRFTPTMSGNTSLLNNTNPYGIKFKVE